MRSVGTLISDSVEFYRTHAFLLSGIMLVPAIMEAIIVFLAPQKVSGLEASILMVIAMIVYVIVYVVVYVLAAIAITLTIADPAQHSSVESAYKPAFTLFFPLLWMSLLNGLIIIGGLILLIIPGIIFSVWFSLAYFTFALEGKRGWQALAASKELVKGNWWAVFGRYMLASLLMMLVVIGIQIGITFIPSGEVGQTLSRLIATLVLTPIFYVYVYLIYKDLSAVRDAAAVVPAEAPVQVTENVG